MMRKRSRVDCYSPCGRWLAEPQAGAEPQAKAEQLPGGLTKGTLDRQEGAARSATCR